MPGSLLVGAEGVILVPDKDSYGSSRPIDGGLELVSRLKSFPTSRTAILVATKDIKVAEYWVNSNGLLGVSVVPLRTEDQALGHDLAQWYAIERERSTGPVNLVLTAWHSVFERCTNSHQPVLLYGRRGTIGSLEPLEEWDKLHEQIIKTRDALLEEEVNANTTG